MFRALVVLLLAVPSIALIIPADHQKFVNRRKALSGGFGIIGGVFLTPAASWASGASEEEAKRYADKYRVKPRCTPTTPQFCSEAYSASIGFTGGGVSDEVINRKAAREAKDQAMLTGMLKDLKKLTSLPSVGSVWVLH